jgi:hypothetical protein
MVPILKPLVPTANNPTQILATSTSTAIRQSSILDAFLELTLTTFEERVVIANPFPLTVVLDHLIERLRD